MADHSSAMAGLNNVTASLLDISSWTKQQIEMAANVTRYAPSAKDLAMAGPRMLMRLGSLTFGAVPDAVDQAFGIRLGQSEIAEATGAIASGIATTAGTTMARTIPPIGLDMLAEVEADDSGLASRLSVEGLRSFGNIFSYATSKWALSCLAMAVILNRTHVYASTRRNLTLRWKSRLVLRLIPILMFLSQARSMLQSIQCQTSPDFALLRWNNASKSSELLFTQDGGILHTLSSALLLNPSDADSCRAVKMVPQSWQDDSVRVDELQGSLSRLWPLFETFCFSHFVETISCAVQGRQVATETGMTLFEHSLAFAEADAAINSQIGWEILGMHRSNGKLEASDSNTAKAPKQSQTQAKKPTEQSAADSVYKRSAIMKKINTPPEVLLVAFLSSLNHLTSHVLNVLDMQNRYRLYHTAFWGLCFMASITTSMLAFSIEDLGEQNLLRFPTVCIIGFIPHVFVLVGTIVCAIIYGLALSISALSPPPDSGGQHTTFSQRLFLAHENMQANMPLASLRISRQMDFYTALLKMGFSVLTMASEAVYLNENREVVVKPITWLEEERLREVEENGAHWLGPSFRAPDSDDGAGLSLRKDNRSPSDPIPNTASGFWKERHAAEPSKTVDRPLRDGIGATERSGRWIMAFELFLGIWRLHVSWTAAVTLWMLANFGVRNRPAWLLRLARRPRAESDKQTKSPDADSTTLNFWLLGSDGELKLPVDDHVDVEIEMRNRFRLDNAQWGDADEKKLDSNLYGWWLNGGWWGEDDNSGNFAPPPKQLEDDVTSVTSATSSVAFGPESEWESDDEEHDNGNDEQTTPTQQRQQQQQQQQQQKLFSRDSTPIADGPLSPDDLARLLHPRTPEQRAEAHALAAHLASDGVLTRSQYRRLSQRERALVLTSTRHRPAGVRANVPPEKLTAEEEAETLEHLIKTRRAAAAGAGPGAAAGSAQPAPSLSWANGAAGLGEGGPQCVVCQSAPRSIIVWPCRCLSLCDECRITLAMKNFDKCPCCRRDVNSFSRIFVP